MPHQCVRCNTFYEDGAQEIVVGCKCGAKLFFYIRKDRLEQARKVTDQFVRLSPTEKKQVEEDVFSIVGHERSDDAPVVLDIEAVRVMKPGKFELDLVHLFNKEEPLIYKLGEGKYVIDLAETFKRKGDVIEEKQAPKAAKPAKR
jgi:predicted  nucleic acid-binding Zn-ribbon protein